MIYVLHRPDSEHRRVVEEFKRALDDRHVEYELLDVDSREGTAKAQAYGIMEYPAALAVRPTNGQALQTWSGQLPLISEVEYYARNSV